MTESTRHGHHNGYFVDGCRCAECKAAAAAYQKALRATRRGKCPAESHGTRHGYDHFGCRCDDCKSANKAYMSQFRARPGKKQIADEASRRWAEANADKYRWRRRTYQRTYAHRKRTRLIVEWRAGRKAAA